jgi:hypothetical protein
VPADPIVGVAFVHLVRAAAWRHNQNRPPGTVPKPEKGSIRTVAVKRFHRPAAPCASRSGPFEAKGRKKRLQSLG